MNKNTKECYKCGNDCEPVDSFTPFGSKSYDPPEPHDPRFVCKDCYSEFKDSKRKMVEKGSGDWRKSKAEKQIAKELNLEWIGSGGVGVLGSDEKWADSYQYIDRKRYDELRKLPYWGYCKICGSIQSGGYCSRKDCENYPEWLKDNEKENEN